MAAALILPQDRAFFEMSVCGVPLLTRAVCAFGRVVDTVYIVKTSLVPAAYPAELEGELAIRAVRPRVVWLEPGRALPMASGLFVTWLPGVFDHKLAVDLLARSKTEDKVVRCHRPDGGATVLWYVGKERCAELARALAQPGPSLGGFLESAATDEHDPGSRLCEPVEDNAARQRVEQTLFAGTRKPTDTWIARHFDRYVSNWITRQLLPYRITPNQVTLISFGLGIAGALLLLLGTHLAAIVGTALLVLCIIVDGCDGEVARLKYMDTPSGRRLDFILDNVVNALALFTIGAGYYLQSGERFFLYAPLFNATSALACAFPVYFLFYQKDAEPKGSDGPKSFNARLTEAVMGRDFMYGLFFLALFNRVHWFVYLTLGGIGFFFASVVVLLAKRRLDRRSAQAQAARSAASLPIPPLPEPSVFRSRDTGTRGRSGTASEYPPVD